MQKIGIITICDNNNYGNRLQNYALSKILDTLGYRSITLWKKDRNNTYKRVKNLIKHVVKPNDINLRRYKNFNRFTKNNISVQYADFRKLNNISDKFDYFVVGSDQVWNYNFDQCKEEDFLEFAEYDKTISYAPSFGVSKIDDNWKHKIRKGLSNIKYLSVRETKGAEIIYNLTGRKAQVVLDPTLLLDKEEWIKIQNKPTKMIKGKYILTYFLGEISEDIKNQIDKISLETGYKVINLCKKEYSDFYTCGPSEFIYLFNNAELILTDSFHACAFSIIFNNPFYVFDRNSVTIKNMNSRLDTLLKTFKQEDRKVDSLNNVKDLFSCDYSESYKILREKQAESMLFLKNALSINSDLKDIVNE